MFFQHDPYSIKILQYCYIKSISLFTLEGYNKDTTYCAYSEATEKYTISNTILFISSVSTLIESDTF